MALLIPSYVYIGIKSVFVRHLVSTEVQQPFIDEIFHLRQCQVYCNYNFTHWDNKITTPPGLYLLGFVYSKSLQFVIGGDCKDYNLLRSLNLVGGLVVFPLILHKFKQGSGSGSSFWTINLISQPLLFTYYFLFYTDVWSAILIVASLSLVSYKHKQYPLISAVLGFISLWFRQTNIVWLAFILAVLVDVKVKERTFMSRISKFTVEIVRSWLSVIPFVVNFILFVIFLKINGGITFGDKENHQMQFHVVQVFYCFAFINFFTWPVWLTTHRVRDYLKFIIGGYYGMNVVFNVISMFGIKFIIDKFTIVHPFLLADNRHYTFYIFKKILSHKYSSFVTIPVYHFSTYNIVSLLSRSRRLSPITVLAYLVSIALTIIPSPLFEPRYYIVPLLVFRLYIMPKKEYSHVIEFIWLNGINLITMYVFFNYEFTWDSEPGSIQRIIW
ncbi:uncharacterized protein SPAPADRAFT_56279 [Spathaspora passalidarum NRRL Y-27907]|uniref:Dol-P-Glc:Glc(2)Man(9)GlcNAc(2)-PP-Dol alpha-1,2-glucosyltransferase n=1 Tax=Spathaspora passalidarum (strain NRRL Y-27907 / 11-Y1) TaxID=619300 RepID=G3AQ79_SPAPN|nr:uncharacterized protein SPAPADRAFT_56279 [Spathaspora passalidarum NRRL Y-27907]EGW31427.1 hypothetical protein SPAPADRAFT_56279 [Spathaspora passalidarum NRRL Y-27907]